MLVEGFTILKIDATESPTIDKLTEIPPFDGDNGFLSIF